VAPWFPLPQPFLEPSDNLDVMVDPIISGARGKGISSVGEQEQSSPAKTQESKFDKVRTRLQDEQATKAELSPEVKQVSMQQKKVLETQLSKRLETTKPNEVFAPDMKRAKDGVAQLTTRVNALPKTPAFEPFRDRLTSIDNQFQATSKLVNSIKGTETPQQLMGIQSQLYQMSENLELMSKALEQLTSGVKSILQTQI
jgi:hypothetical protein